jgi:Type II secretion system (T2SS), protein E, N-terminal domain
MTASTVEACRRRADHAGVRFVTLEPTPGAQDSHLPVDPAVRKLLPPQLCLEHGMLPVAIEDGRVLIAAAEPVHYLPYEVAATLSGRPVSFVLAPADQIRRALAPGKDPS